MSADSSLPREIYGPKHRLLISPFVKQKLQKISDGSNRPMSVIFSFCVRHALFVGAYNTIPEGYTIPKPSDTLGVRTPVSVRERMKDLSWLKGCTMSDLFDYLCFYSLSAKGVEDWISFFSTGTDIVFDVHMYLYTQTECQKSNQSYLEHQSLTQLSNKLNK